MGISLVAEAAVWRGEVALARIRSTFSEMKPSMMGMQLLPSPPALPSSNFTLSPSFAVRVSLKPWVAASSAGWGASWQMPMVKVWSAVPAGA